MDLSVFGLALARLAQQREGLLVAPELVEERGEVHARGLEARIEAQSRPVLAFGALGVSTGLREERQVVVRGAEVGGGELERLVLAERGAQGVSLGRPEEIAALAVYLATDEAAFMTGCDLRIDGGFTL